MIFFLFLRIFFTFLVKVIVSNDESKTVVEGIPVDLGRKEKLVDTKKVNKAECCPICALDLKPNYTVGTFENLDLFLCIQISDRFKL